MVHDLWQGDYLVSTDRTLLDADAVHRYLTVSYWAAGIPRAVVDRSLENSLCFGLYHAPQGATERTQVGLARVVTDNATFAYLCDVYVLEQHRGSGLGKLLMRAVHSHPALQGLRRFSLFTRDAHGLYAQFGWSALSSPDRAMERVDRDVYKRGG